MECVMFVSDLMQTEVITVAPQTSLGDAVRIMLVRHVSGLPVVEGGGLVGVITGGDVLRRVELGSEGKPTGWIKAFFSPASAALEYVHTHGVHVRDVMTPAPLAVTAGTDVAEAATLMVTHRIKRLPVVQGDALIGLISRTDILRVLARRLISQEDPLTEAGISAHIRGALRRERWAPKSGVKVDVSGNSVRLSGAVYSAAERQAINVIAETTPGVQDVADHLTLVDAGAAMAFPAG